ncbi:MAG: substrate-binding domain-containing protein [Syntrophales bacterium]
MRKKVCYIVFAISVFLSLSAINLGHVKAEGVLYVYGPGGPYPAMKEAAESFGKQQNVKMEVAAGPTNQWIEKAKKDADIIYSGAEYMMTDFIFAMEGRIDETTVTPLYLRPSSILVRPGNPKKIKDFPDLLKAGMKVLVVNGAGQAGLWEDIVGKDGKIETVKKFRKNIVAYAPNSAVAKKIWMENKEIDAWLIWNIWQVSNPDIADLVPMSKKYLLYRDCGVALTKQGKDKELANKFYEFVQSEDGARIFAKWGWIKPKKK